MTKQSTKFQPSVYISAEEYVVASDAKGVRFVSAQGLHERLGIESNFLSWCAKMLSCGFQEGEDYHIIRDEDHDLDIDIPEDFILHIDCAKVIIKIQNSIANGKHPQQFHWDNKANILAFVAMSYEANDTPLKASKRTAIHGQLRSMMSILK